MKNRTMKAIVKQLEKHRDKIGAERDRLREMQSEIEELLEPCQEGIEALDAAISHFSEVA